MKLGILQCDSVMKAYQAEFGNYPQMFINLFQKVTPEIEVTIYDVEQGEYPVSPHECDAYITTGSKASVYDKLPWLDDLKTFIRVLYTKKIKLVGICFGHQLIAEIFGGKTEKSNKGWGVGVSINTVISHQDWMQPACDTLNLIVSHQDQVSRLPEGAKLLASSAFCPNYFYQLGDSLLSIQGHPEFSKSYSDTLMHHRIEKIGDETYQKGLNSLELKADDILFAQWLMNYFSLPPAV